MTEPAGRVLVVDDKENMLTLLAKILGERYQVTTASDSGRALSLLATTEFDVVLTDVRMPGADGFEVIAQVKKRWPETEVIMMTAFASVESAVEAIRQGAYDYLQKPFDPDDVSLVVARALERKRLDLQLQAAEPAEDLVTLSYKDVVNRARDRASREYLAALMRAFGGNVTQAAERAGIERESMHRLLKRYSLRAETFREGEAAPPPDEKKP